MKVFRRRNVISKTVAREHHNHAQSEQVLDWALRSLLLSSEVGRCVLNEFKRGIDGVSSGYQSLFRSLYIKQVVLARVDIDGGFTHHVMWSPLESSDPIDYPAGQNN